MVISDVLLAGVLYHLWKKYELADQNYKKALTIDPKHQYALDNYALLQRVWVQH
jgi:Tfp pilus assembly protein PilF